MTEMLLGYGLTLVLHASLLLGLAWLIDACFGAGRPRLVEAAWRGALFVPLLTAALAVAMSGAWGRAPLEPDQTVAGGVATTLPTGPVEGGLVAPTRLANAQPAAAGHVAPAAASSSVGALRIDPVVARGLLLGWTALGASLLLLSLAGLVGMADLLRRAQRLPADDRRRRIASEVAAALGLPTPRLGELDSLHSPLALPGHRILLPRWSHALGVDQQRALLAHELTHLARRDPAWRLLQRLALLVLCWHPLAWRAQRRLDALAEQACDAAAARLLGSGRPLAECLAACLARSPRATRPHLPRLLVAMAAGDSDVVRRVESLLKEKPMNRFEWSGRQRPLFLGLSLCVATTLALGGAVGVAVATSTGDRHSVHIKNKGSQTSATAVITRKGYALKVEQSGQIRFADDESDVVDMAPRSSLLIEETIDGVSHTLRLVPGNAGIERDYRRDGRAQPFDATARAWLAAAIPSLLRATGLAAEARVERKLARGGASAVLDEIDLIPSDHVRGRYLGLLFDATPLDAEHQRRAQQQIAAIGSSFELRNTLVRAIHSAHVDATERAALLALADSITSDFERAELLIDSRARLSGDHATMHRAWQQVAAGINSDFERRRALESVFDGRSEPALLHMALDLAAGIGSDFEKRSLLETAASHAAEQRALLGAWLASADTLRSDFERRSALASITRGRIDAATADGVLMLIARMGSQSERREALVALAAAMPADAGLIERYRAVARTLGNFERGEAERALDRFALR
jgi:beta-lactamase regulating signal transducer with metallopeptidase domain